MVKTNPALGLYERLAFRITHEDERKFYMRHDCRVAVASASCQPLRLAPAAMQNPLCVPIRLRTAREDQVAGSFKGYSVAIGCHGSVSRIARIKAYEDSNVDIGIACGLPGRAACWANDVAITWRYRFSLEKLDIRRTQWRSKLAVCDHHR